MSADYPSSSINWMDEERKEKVEQEVDRRGMSGTSELMREIVDMYLSRSSLEEEVDQLEAEIEALEQEVEQKQDQIENKREVLEYKKELLSEQESVSHEIELKLEHLAGMKQLDMQYEYNPRYKEVLQNHPHISTQEELEDLIEDYVDEVDPQERLPQNVLEQAGGDEL
ncbi:hypothetical protein [Haloarchaeobius baliensis]|uniref:hypothetical protein n=1 Tax=Haloarchaeobius baliensis TaxID=1670458 RepID=UPI003F885423